MTSEIEKYLLRIQSVIGSKVKMGPDQEITEIHIVSDLRRSPKQILRDVEAVLLSEFDLPIDYKKVSIAQIRGDAVKNDDEGRLKLKSVDYSNDESSTQVNVTLEKFTQLYTGNRHGIKTTQNVMRLSAKATLAAVENYLGLYDIFVFEDCQEVIVAGVRVVVVALISIYNSREEFFIGTAKVNSDINEAVSRATLDAVNRQINRPNVIL